MVTSFIELLNGSKNRCFVFEKSSIETSTRAETSKDGDFLWKFNFRYLLDSTICISAIELIFLVDRLLSGKFPIKISFSTLNRDSWASWRNEINRAIKVKSRRQALAPEFFHSPGRSIRIPSDLSH